MRGLGVVVQSHLVSPAPALTLVVPTGCFPASTTVPLVSQYKGTLSIQGLLDEEVLAKGLYLISCHRRR